MIDQKTHKLSDFKITPKFVKYILIIMCNNCHVKFVLFFLLFLQTNLQTIPNVSQNFLLAYQTAWNANYVFTLGNLIPKMVITIKGNLQS